MRVCVVRYMYIYTGITWHVIARIYAMRHPVRWCFIAPLPVNQLMGLVRPLLWVNVKPLRRRQVDR